jgi:predicted DNA-binding protein (UPF0251 family)
MPRNLTGLELAILEGALSAGETVESLSQKAGVSSSDLQNVFGMSGLSLPSATAAKITAEEQTAYSAALRSDVSAAMLPSIYGFSSESMLGRLKESELRIPLTSSEMDAFNIAQSEGLTVDQAATRFGVTADYVNTGLGAAGLSLTGKKPAAPKIGSDNPASAFGQMPDYNQMASIFGQIPQIPSLRMVMKNSKRQADPNWKGTTDTILTSGQGLTTDANISVKTLLGT